MNFICFVTLSVLLFLSSLLGYRKCRSTVLYALAIGGVVNANFFHAGNYPIYCFGLPFGIDSILYTLFVFCVIVMFIKENRGSAYLLAVSSILAILFSAIMQLTASLLSSGSSIEIWKSFGTFLISSVASVVAIFITIETLVKFKEKISPCLQLVLGILIATTIDAFIYFPATILINAIPENIVSLLIASFIGKLIAMLCGVITLYFMSKYDKKRNIE